MKINDVEKILDVPKATIRFYEKEGLLTPKRNANAYWEYSQSDIELLKKIVVLRKIGVPVEDIKLMLHDKLMLKDALSKNMDALHQQMKELEGALKLCSMLRSKEDSFASFDEEYYWNAMHAEEQTGNLFFDIVNDVIEFEKQVIGNEFGLLDQDGKLKFSFGKSVLIAFAMCVAAGALWFFMDGMNPTAFKDGFIFPFVCIIISSVLGLPVFFLEKKSKKAAQVIRKIGMGLGVAFLVAIVLLMIFGEV